jgi:hypothetical protein
MSITDVSQEGAESADYLGTTVGSKCDQVRYFAAVPRTVLLSDAHVSGRVHDLAEALYRNLSYRPAALDILTLPM